MNLYLIRHCQTTGQEPEAPLTGEGQVQAERLADALAGAGIERIVSSPFRRARDSAGPLARRLGIEVELDARLRERALCGAPRPDWLERLRESFADLDLCLEGGESSRAAMARGAAVLEEVRRRPARTTALVTHGNLLALLLQHLDGRPGFDAWRRLANPDVYRVSFDEGAPRVERVYEAERAAEREAERVTEPEAERAAERAAEREPGVEYRVSPPVSEEALNELYGASWPRHRWSDFRPLLERSLAYVCAYREDRLIGFVYLAWDGGVHAFLLEPTVHPSLRRRGIGRELVRRAIALAGERGAHWVHVDFEPHLRGFYEGCGFQPTDAGLVYVGPARS